MYLNKLLTLCFFAWYGLTAVAGMPVVGNKTEASSALPSEDYLPGMMREDEIQEIGKIDFAERTEHQTIQDEEDTVIRSLGDPLVTSQWWYEALQLNQLWQISTGKNIIIADCDAGYYTSEADLRTKLITKYRQDTADHDAPFAVDDGAFRSHGTAVASLLVGAMDGYGTNGIAYNARLVPLQNYNYDSSIDDLDIREATEKCILAAASNPQIRILVVQSQLPEGSLESDPGIRSAIQLASLAGLLVVIPAGNGGKEIDAPRYRSGALVVGGVSRQGERSIFSNFGSGVDIASYSENIRTVFGPNGRTGIFGGTAAAAAIVAATAALILETNPDLSPGEIKQIIQLTRKQPDGSEVVGGVLDPLRAVRLAQSSRRN